MGHAADRKPVLFLFHQPEIYAIFSIFDNVCMFHAGIVGGSEQVPELSVPDKQEIKYIKSKG